MLYEKSKAKDIIHNKEDLSKIVGENLNKMATVVGATLGPGGRAVLIEREGQPPLATKDGVTSLNLSVLIKLRPILLLRQLKKSVSILQRMPVMVRLLPLFLLMLLLSTDKSSLRTTQNTTLNVSLTSSKICTKTSSYHILNLRRRMCLKRKNWLTWLQSLPTETEKLQK